MDRRFEWVGGREGAERGLGGVAGEVEVGDLAMEQLVVDHTREEDLERMRDVSWNHLVQCRRLDAGVRSRASCPGWTV